MDYASPLHAYLISLAAAVAAVGLAICWFGVLVAVLTALGRRQWWWAVPMLILGPIVAIPYSLVESKADYPKQLMLRGLSILLGVALITGITLLYWS